MDFLKEWKRLCSVPQKKTAREDLARYHGFSQCDCAFVKYDFYDEYGVHGVAPPELLHLLYLGLVKETCLYTLGTVRALVTDGRMDEVLQTIAFRFKNIPRYRFVLSTVFVNHNYTSLAGAGSIPQDHLEVEYWVLISKN